MFSGVRWFIQTFRTVTWFVSSLLDLATVIAPDSRRGWEFLVFFLDKHWLLQIEMSACQAIIFFTE